MFLISLVVSGFAARGAVMALLSGVQTLARACGIAVAGT
jgi:hypothetical protein